MPGEDIEQLQKLEFAIDAHPEQRLALLQEYVLEANDREEWARRTLLYNIAMGRGEMPNKQPPMTFYGQIGSITFGDQFGDIQNTLTNLSTKGPDGQQIAEALKQLTQKVIDSPEMAPARKKEAVEVISSIAQQADAEPGKRSKAVVRVLLESFPKLLETAKDAAEIWDKWGGPIRMYFGI